MQLHFIRHATLQLVYAGQRLLIDPMLSPAQAMDPVANAASTARIPLVDLPLSADELQHLIRETNGVLVTHTHRDHWDTRAIELLPKSLPTLTQPSSETTIRDSGFNAVQAVMNQTTWNDIAIFRTEGRHGTGDIGRAMGAVSGFVLKATAEPTVYVAGDTIWCAEVAETLRTFQPDVVILNTGAAQFLTGDPITMGADDVLQVCRTVPRAKVVAVHMDTINHCWLTRALLAEALTKTGLQDHVEIPADGARLIFNATH